MNFLAVLLLSLLISVKSSTQDETLHKNTGRNVRSSKQDGTFHKNTERNGIADLSVDFTNGTKHESQLPRQRRSLGRPPVFQKLGPLSNCYLKFFIDNKPPTGFKSSSNNPEDIRYICERQTGKTELFSTWCFSTMFDMSSGIAVYSAYRVTQAQGQTLKDPNKLHSRGGQQFFIEGLQDVFKVDYGYRLDDMYSNTDDLPCIEKGHLVPAETYSFSEANLKCTFSYINAVPQYAAFNRGKWKVYEGKIRQFAVKCSDLDGDTYLLTGTSNKWYNIFAFDHDKTSKYSKTPHMYEAPKTMIPKSMWTACCCMRDDEPVGSFAVIGNNVWGKGDMYTTGLTIKQLEQQLGDIFDKVDLFPGNRDCKEAHFDIDKEL